jgi:hypothetical protein
MGYPMTYRRILGRNRLGKGDYAVTPAALYPYVDIDKENCGFKSHEALERAYRGNFKWQQEYRISVENARSLLLGDLRRLEDDTVDEVAICQVIANKTALALDVVAAVLKEWIAT